MSKKELRNKEAIKEEIVQINLYMSDLTVFYGKDVVKTPYWSFAAQYRNHLMGQFLGLIEYEKEIEYE